MTWNYQIVKTTEGNGHVYGIKEVLHHGNGEIRSWTEGYVWPSGETVEELVAELGYMLQDAKNRPVLVLENGKLTQEGAENAR